MKSICQNGRAAASSQFGRSAADISLNLPHAIGYRLSGADFYCFKQHQIFYMLMFERIYCVTSEASRNFFPIRVLCLYGVWWKDSVLQFSQAFPSHRYTAACAPTFAAILFIVVYPLPHYTHTPNETVN